MERRCEPRVLVELPVDVWSDGRMLGCFSTIDVSRGGLGLHARKKTLPERALVHTIVRLGEEAHPATALIQSSSPGRYGLLLADDADVLWALLLERQAARAAA